MEGDPSPAESTLLLTCFDKSSRVHYSLSVYLKPEVLSVWLYRGLLYRTLPITKTDDLPVGQVGTPMETPLLQHEMTPYTLFLS